MEASEVLRAALHDQVRAEGKWLLQDGTGEGCVHAKEGASRVGRRGPRLDVGDAKQRVRDGFHPDQFRAGRDRRRRLGIERVNLDAPRC